MVFFCLCYSQWPSRAVFPASCLDLKNFQRFSIHQSDSSEQYINVSAQWLITLNDFCPIYELLSEMNKCQMFSFGLSFSPIFNKIAARVRNHSLTPLLPLGLNARVPCKDASIKNYKVQCYISIQTKFP